MENEKLKSSERGSLSLEHILFIGAVVLITTGLATFYGNMNTYFSNIGFSASPTNIGSSSSGVAP